MNASAAGSPAARLRDMLSRNEPIVAPGVHDPLSAAAAETVGFSVIYYGGLMTALQLRNSESVLSVLDAVENARRISDVIDAPLIVDAEGGFGGPVQVARTTRALETAGVAAFHVEDSRFPRPLHGHEMISSTQMRDRIRAALEARRDPDTLIIARTEAYGATGGDLDETLRRLHAYKAAGADALMPMAFEVEAAARIAEEFRSETLVYLGLTRRSHDDELSVGEIFSMGYKVILYPILTISAAYMAIRTVLRQLKTNRKSGLDQVDLVDVWTELDQFIRPAGDQTGAG